MGCSQYRQERIRPHGQRAMSIPPRPTAHLIMSQPDLALRLFTTPFDGPSTARHPYDVCQGRLLWGTHDVGRQRRRVAQTPTDEEPAAPVGLPRRGEGAPHPVIPARAFGPIASAPPVPALRHQRRQDAFDLVLPTRPPDILLPRDGHDIGVVLLFPPPPQPPIIAIGAIACPPRGRHPRLEGSLEQLMRQRRFRGTTLLGWY